MDRMGFPNTPPHPVHPVLIKLDFIPSTKVFAMFCKIPSVPATDALMFGTVTESPLRPPETHAAEDR